MFRIHQFHPLGRRSAAVLLAAWLVLLSCLPQRVSAEETAAVRWTPDQSGRVCLPAGDVILPTGPVGVSARGAVLLEAESGEIIFGQNAHTPMPMASTTKIMTALVALEALPLETMVTVTAESVGVEGSSIYLVEGERLTLEQLLYALLLSSANDAATAIAIAAAGSVADFADLMNRKAEALGLTDTHFANPHGLDAEQHYTTAYELAMITRAALEHPVFREICATRKKTIPLHGQEDGRLLINHNKLLKAYEGCIGVKTGYTRKTGRCLVSAACREGVTLIAVTLNAPDDWRDHTSMLDHGFLRYTAIRLGGEGFFSAPLALVSGNRDYALAECRSTLTVTLRRDHGPILCAVELPRFEFAPIGQGQAVGRLVFYEERPDGEVRRLGEVPLLAAYSVGEITYPPTLWERILGLFS